MEIKTDYASTNELGAIILGNYCSVWGEHSIVYGNKCDVYGDNCIIYGSNCVVYGTNILNYGQGTRFIRSRSVPAEQQVRARVEEKDGKFIWNEIQAVKKPKMQLVLEKLREIDSKTEEEEKQCIICKDNKSVIALNCGHKKLCVTCALIVVKKFKECPLCKTKVTSVLRVYE